MRALRLSSCLLGLLLLCDAGAGEARQLARKSFGGKGWSQAEGADSLPLPASFAEVVRGSFSFDLERTGDIPFSRPQTLFELVDDVGETLLRVKVSWTSEAEPGNPVLVVQGDGGGGEYRSHGMGLWPTFTELDRPLAVGGRVHVDLTWDDASRTSAVFVDGREQRAGHGGFDPVQKRWHPDQRDAVNAELARRGKAALFDSRPLSYFLSRVAAVHLGNHDGPGRSPTRPRSLLQQARIENFAVFVDEIPPPGEAPAIAAISHDAARVAGFSGRLVAGDVMTVTLQGTAAATGTFDVVHFPGLDRRIALDWRGWGVPLGEQAFSGEGEVNLRDVEGYRVFAATAPFDPLAPGFEPAAELDVREQRYLLENLEIDAAHYLAVVAVMKDGTLRPVIAPVVRQPLAEGEPGAYRGSWQAGYADRYARAAVVGRLERGSQAATMVAAGLVAVDPSLTVEVAAEPDVLAADESSAAKVTVTVTDANGNAVAGHEIRFLLATTSQYTGVVGGGAFTEQVGGALTADHRGVTDLFGRLTATYVAGFAAKTAVIVARDMASNSTGAGHVRTFIHGTAQLELEPARQPAAASGYEITVTSSDQWLTADGKSQARITARVTLGGQPVEGSRVGFQIAAGTGQLRTVSETTGRNGEARAVYTAGKKIGSVLITATDAAAGVSGSVQIELRSDAPAKIAIAVDPAKLPADGRSRARVLVRVTDVNDNPSDNVEVEYAVTEGGGGIKDAKGLTDRAGESENTYTAGRAPGRVSIGIVVRSAAPSEEELGQARELAVAVKDFRFF